MRNVIVVLATAWTCLTVPVPAGTQTGNDAQTYESPALQLVSQALHEGRPGALEDFWARVISIGGTLSGTDWSRYSHREGPQAAELIRISPVCRNASTRLTNSAIWFQLAKMRLTSLSSLGGALLQFRTSACARGPRAYSRSHFRRPWTSFAWCRSEGRPTSRQSLRDLVARRSCPFVRDPV